jgi:hypothetical protein
LAFGSALVLLASGVRAAPVLRVVRTTPTGPSLLSNGSFEQLSEGQAADWHAAPQGFRVTEGAGREGSRALLGETKEASHWSGASQTITLNQTHPAPFVVRGWSKAENVSGSADSGYALYADVIYTDGTPLWGQTSNFRCGSHDWERREFVIHPEKPVQTLTLHCLLRGHTGKVWFDDVSVVEAAAQAGTVFFHGAAVSSSAEAPKPVGKRSRLRTSDALELELRGYCFESARANRRALSVRSLPGLLVRDVAANSDFHSLNQGVCAELGLRLQTTWTAQSNHLVLEGRVSDTTGRDRAVTVLFGLPVDATGWRWGDDLRHSRVIQGAGEFVKETTIRCGATGTMSLYPVGPIWDDRTGLAVAIDMTQPAVYRLGYHAGLKFLFLAYDFGLAPDTERFPGAADFRFVLYQFDPRWGFRSAWQKFTEIFPGPFVVRSKDQGIWMPFTDVSKVEGWQDFGFRYHEGNNNVPWDDAHGVLSFRYTEPMTWWMPMKPEMPRTLAGALQVREECERGPDPRMRGMAAVSELAAMHNESGEPGLQFQDTPWCNGAIWSLNPNPWLGTPTPAGPGNDPLGRSDTQPGPLKATPVTNAGTVYWNDSLKAALYGPEAQGRLDGEYLDSLEGYVTADFNFRREHFRPTTVPLTFTTEARQVALFKGLAVFEFTRWMAEDVHRLGKLMFANGVPSRFAFLCPWLDVMGTETDWLPDGRYQPAAILQMDLWRTLSGAKPYLLLMNSDYEQFTPEWVDKYFQRALFYGMWPSFFSHNASENPYWQNPKWYNRDRPLFRQYLPLIRRVAEAGWQPVTGAQCDNAAVLLERFGPDADGAIFLTLHNDTAQRQSGVVRIDASALRLPNRCRARDLMSGEEFSKPQNAWPCALEPQETRVWVLPP